MVQVSVAIGKFMLLLLEAVLWAAIVGGGWLIAAGLVAGAAYLIGRRLWSRRASRKSPPET